MALDEEQTLLDLVSKIVAAYVTGNTLAPEALPDVIRSVYAVFADIERGDSVAVAAAPEPAVPIKKSVFPDYIICLEDGRKMKMLKRHLQTAYGMTPDEYRKRWNLPATYPMTAPNYAARRSTLAKDSGLGMKRYGPQSTKIEAVASTDIEAPADGEAAEPERDAAPEVQIFKARARGKKKTLRSEG